MKPCSGLSRKLASRSPLELLRRVIKLFSEPGDIVLDCFMGSGTSAMAAIKEKRHYIGIDKSQEYVDLAKRNIEACNTNDFI